LCSRIERVGEPFPILHTFSRVQPLPVTETQEVALYTVETAGRR
jgi:hypothetical protein